MNPCSSETLHLGPKILDDSEQIIQPGGIRRISEVSSNDTWWFERTLLAVKGKYGKKTVQTRPKNVTRKKTDQQEKLMAFAQVVQNEALLELEPV